MASIMGNTTEAYGRAGGIPPAPGPAPRYDAVAQWLHWGVFALLALQLFVGEVMDDLPRAGTLRGTAFDAHETLGLALLFVVFARLSWKMAHPVRPLAGPAWQRHAATFTHALLYALVLALPVTGYFLIGAQGHGAAFFGWEIPVPIARDRSTAKLLENIHGAFADALMIVVSLHAAAALWHHFVARDDTLRRMLPARWLGGVRD